MHTSRIIPSFEQVYNSETHSFKIPDEIQSAALYRLFGLFLVATQIAQNPGLLVEIKGSARNVLDALAMRLDRNTLTCYPSVGRIARESGYASAGVSAALKKLERLGLFSRTHRKHDTNVYRFGLAKVKPVAEGQEASPGTAGPAQLPAQDSSPAPRMAAREPLAKSSSPANASHFSENGTSAPTQLPAQESSPAPRMAATEPPAKSSSVASTSHFSENDASKARFLENEDNLVDDDDSFLISKSLEIIHHHDSARKVKNEPEQVKTKKPETVDMTLPPEWVVAYNELVKAGMFERVAKKLVKLMRENERSAQYALDWLAVFVHRKETGEVFSIGWLKSCLENNDPVPPLDSRPPKKEEKETYSGWDYMEIEFKDSIANWVDPPGTVTEEEVSPVSASVEEDENSDADTDEDEDANKKKKKKGSEHKPPTLPYG